MFSSARAFHCFAQLSTVPVFSWQFPEPHSQMRRGYSSCSLRVYVAGAAWTLRMSSPLKWALWFLLRPGKAQELRSGESVASRELSSCSVPVPVPLLGMLLKDVYQFVCVMAVLQMVYFISLCDFILL